MRKNSLHDRVPFAAVPTIIVNSPERPSRTLSLLKDMRNEQTSTNGGGSLDLDLCAARTAAVVTPPALETRMEPDDPEVRVQDESLHPADSGQPCSFNKPSAVETLPTLSRHRAHARSHTLPISHSASSSTTGSASASASSRSPTPTLTSHTSSHSFSLLTPSSISPASVSLSHVSPSTAFVSSIAPRHATRRSGPRTHTTKPAPTAETVDKDIAAAIDLNDIDNMSSISTTRLQELRAREIPSVVINPLADTGPEEVMVPLLAPTPLRAGTSLPPPPLSRSSSAASTASANGGNRGILRRIFIDRAGTPSQHLSRPTFPPMSLTSYSPVPHTPMTLWEHVRLAFNQLVSFGLSTFFLLGVVIWAMAAEALYAIPNFFKRVKAPKYEWDDDRYWRREGKKISKEPRDYARQIGLDIENQTVETEDGYYLRMHKVVDPNAQPRADGRGGFPVLILHGLFQSSGSFITSEDRSLAFWLARKGYQVYLGNTRGIFDMGHRSYSRADPRFWDWTIRDLAMFDLPAMVDHVCQDTGYDKIAFMGHSQGNGLTFISLSLGMVPNLGKKLSVFIALAPAVYAGPLTTGFPFTALSRLEWHTWKRFFGVLDFIPLMRYAYDYCPARLFAFAGYIMFAFLFSWTDANWLKRRKTKMFRFTPTPVSSASIFWWCGKGGFADRKCTLDDSLERWYDDRFPPLSIYHGGRDFLVLTEPLLERLEKKEKDVKVIKVTKLDKSEHCDFYWAAEAVEWAYESFVDDIESTRPRYPEEEE